MPSTIRTLDAAILMMIIADTGGMTSIRRVNAAAAATTASRAWQPPAPFPKDLLPIGSHRRRQCLGLRGGISIERQKQLVDDLGWEKGIEAGQEEEDREVKHQYAPVSIHPPGMSSPILHFYRMFSCHHHLRACAAQLPPPSPQPFALRYSAPLLLTIPSPPPASNNRSKKFWTSFSPRSSQAGG